MSINKLHAEVLSGAPGAEERLFQSLSERFRLFLQHRIQDRQESEDILQETLMTISAKYREVKFDSSFSAWAYTVLKNNVLMNYRTKGRNQDKFTTLDDAEQSLSTSDQRAGLESRLLDCLKKLNRANRRHARVVNLHYQGYSTTDICERMKLSTNGLYLLLMRAREALKGCIEKGAPRL